MTNTIIWTIAIITVLGLVLALVLFLVAKKFKVEEDPRIDEVEKAMPGANCGGCGFAGCRAFAEAAVKADDLEAIFCPVGGNDVMAKVAAILGHEVKVKDPQVAVVRCNGTCEARPVRARRPSATGATISRNSSSPPATPRGTASSIRRTWRHSSRSSFS